ncbi:hypothetical protein D3C75_1285750 [compost metagenome]
MTWPPDPGDGPGGFLLENGGQQPAGDKADGDRYADAAHGVALDLAAQLLEVGGSGLLYLIAFLAQDVGG